jgi:nucleoside-diphosphate-sugar epimerase
MKVLLVGGSGHVGSLIAPYLRPHHELRVLDLHPPRDAALDHVEGSVTDPAALARALSGMDTFIYLVMKSGQGGSATDQDIATIIDNYDVNAKGLHLLLFTAQQMGIARGIYTSTMSVHHRARTWYPAEELVPLDTPSVYGLTKGLGEQICQYFARWFDMRLIALRITAPRARSQWVEERRLPREQPDGTRLYVTDEEDLARAYLGALSAIATGHGRFDAVFIAGDEAEEEHNLSKAQVLLGWRPQSQQRLRP